MYAHCWLLLLGLLTLHSVQGAKHIRSRSLEDEDEALPMAAYAGNNGRPSENFPLSLCHSDCDSDEDCQEGLICYQREGREPIPGCSGSDPFSGNDFCVEETVRDGDIPEADSGPSPRDLAVQWQNQDPNLGQQTDEIKAQRLALATLYYATGGDQWIVNGGWLSYDVDECLWYNTGDGPVCDNDGSYRILSLTANGLNGSIPSQIGDLTALTTFEVGINQLTRILPSEFGTLMGMEIINITQNLFSGVPPQILNLKNVRAFDINDNLFAGNIAPQLGAAFPNMTHLDCNQNFFTGAIPSELGRMTNLLRMDLSSNLLNGTIASDIIDGSSKMTHLELSNNAISGVLPSNLDKLIDLRILSLGTNQIVGTLAPELGSLTALHHVDVQDNSISGVLPSDLSKLVALHSLQLSANQISGVVPSEFGELVALESFNASANSVSGSIPSQIGTMTSLRELDLSGNDLSGGLPTDLVSATALQSLYLEGNAIASPIPSEIGLATNLYFLVLDNNFIESSIPSQIGTAYNLKDILLENNLLTGPIPSEIGLIRGTTGLTVEVDRSPFDAWSRQSQQPLFSSKGLERLHLAGNTGITGTIPTELGALQSLESFTLADTSLTGQVPDGLCLTTGFALGCCECFPSR